MYVCAAIAPDEIASTATTAPSAVINFFTSSPLRPEASV
jgi:hypothetical protein